MKTNLFIHLFDRTKDWEDPHCCRFVKIHYNNDLAGLVTDMARSNQSTPDDIRMFVYPTAAVWQKQLNDWRARIDWKKYPVKRCAI